MCAGLAHRFANAHPCQSFYKRLIVRFMVVWAFGKAHPIGGTGLARRVVCEVCVAKMA